MKLSEQTRHRVTGTVFLLAVAAIVLPMLFDEGPPELERPYPAAPQELAVQPDPSAAPDMNELAEAAGRLVESVDADGFATDTGVRLGEPVLLPEAVQPDSSATENALEPAWAVQVGAFSEHANAEALRERLRADGYAALMSTIRSDAGESTRVAVGPIISRADAATLKQELERRYSVDAVVRRVTH
ncbi:MAG: hypothetical protein F4Y86_17575 [Gammaproteobacteria bacterium]|nr:SPOR domain-containing protein [Gammaproteobacteria bacterium]MXY54322.1 hypothetical protein [Gammaproteobacteria bacterium]MYB37559.1 hypothetical protein [Gammaproteobacteria bacterium]